ncbi:ankyrin [Aspergillus uvarum CBS 121591]|uniref:Ankyrin n=1 Tax=Aspergillus uvarum CBS 121591 TaxID=1448315 RepID=A0A319DCI9_9EURO|nr:ankyrin [Aspergillus uvarum CBS 121591]PYH77562.1 ankyrin [Aspergillus uvarum CBS 121591]
MLLQLPLEILEMIVAELAYRADINALLNPYLYRLSADYGSSLNRLWAARVDQCDTARRWIAIMRDTPSMNRPETRYMQGDAAAALHEAIAHGQTEPWTWSMSTLAIRGAELVHMLLGWEGIDAQARDAAGHTTLLVAAMDTCEAVVDLLLADGRADSNAADIHEKTPLHAAVRREGAGVVDQLLGSGRTATSTSWNDYSAQNGWTWGRGTRVVAVFHHHYALVRQLIQRGAAVPSVLYNGTSILLFPTKVGMLLRCKCCWMQAPVPPAGVGLLLAAGADPHIASLPTNRG